MADRHEVDELELYAWVGWDEFGSGKLGLKQGSVPAGLIPMAATSQEKLEKYWPQAEALAATYGKRVFLVRLKVVEIVRETVRGQIG